MVKKECLWLFFFYCKYVFCDHLSIGFGHLSYGTTQLTIMQRIVGVIDSLEEPVF